MIWGLREATWPLGSNMGPQDVLMGSQRGNMECQGSHQRPRGDLVGPQGSHLRPPRWSKIALREITWRSQRGEVTHNV